MKCVEKYTYAKYVLYDRKKYCMIAKHGVEGGTMGYKFKLQTLTKSKCDLPILVIIYLVHFHFARTCG